MADEKTKGQGSRARSTKRASSARSKSSSRSAGTRSGAKRTGAKRSAGTRSSRPRTKSGAAAGSRGGALLAALVAVRARLARGVVLTAERLQETLDDTVRRGRITRDDAEKLLQDLLTIGRKQTEDVLTEVEQLVRKGPGGVADAARQAGERARTRVQRSESADRVLREVDRARRAAGVGSAFPVTGYDMLSASQVAGRLDDLTRAELRKVRDYERRHQARKSVIAAIEKRLAQ